MFKNNQENYDETENMEEQDIETIIGPSVKLEGELLGEGNISIHGTVSGKIETKGNLMIGEGSLIKAEVSAANVSVAGTVEGDIHSKEKLEIIENGKVIGDITSSTLSISPGANFSGQSNMHDKTETESAEESQDQPEDKE